LQERVKPLVFEDEASRDVIKELEQFSKGPATDYKIEE